VISPPFSNDVRASAPRSSNAALIMARAISRITTDTETTFQRATKPSAGNALDAKKNARQLNVGGRLFEQFRPAALRPWLLPAFSKDPRRSSDPLASWKDVPCRDHRSPRASLSRPGLP